MLHNSSNEGTILGIDIGDARIGIARAHSVAKIPEPLTVLSVTDNVLQDLTELIASENAILLIIGMPIPQKSSSNMQTRKVQEFVTKLQNRINIPISYVDESYTSSEADDLMLSFKQKQISNDAIAACVILQRYFTEGPLQYA